MRAISTLAVAMRQQWWRPGRGGAELKSWLTASQRPEQHGSRIALFKRLPDLTDGERKLASALVSR